ncbi:MAG TPA: Gfo/Idh/MocA family oxidoreductase [Chloroflexota bacterium]|nr:Gfo/Idh/MocA family oxidoreductase [Chloroflexota bacterium]
MITPLRVALLSAAHVHAGAYAEALSQIEGATLAAVWDDQAVRGRPFAAKYTVPFQPSLEDLWADCDAVVVTAENARHRRLCEAACAAGKHVLCEKPLAISQEDAEAMIAVADSAGVVLATAFPMRHSLPARALHRAIRAGVVGEVLAIRATNRGTSPPGWFQDPALAGGGAVIDHTVHVADLLRWYLEDEPETVQAEISHGLHGGAVDDAAFLTITFEGGVVVTHDPSWSRPPSYPIWGDITMEVVGTRGTLDLNAFSQNIHYYPRQTDHAEWLPWGTNADRAMVEDFVAAIREGRPPAATGRDGERALAVALAAYESARSGQPVAVAPPAR